MQKQLADGLVLRTLSEGVASDRARLPQFYADINGEGDPEWVKDGLVAWTEDLMTDHPTTTPDDIFVVVDPAQDERIVSATLLIPQTWRYEELEIPMGRPELVGTHPEYRGRGLVRALFNAVHERSAVLGHQLQAITGIPHFYRQFGYTMALDLDTAAIYPLTVVRGTPADYTPTFTLRVATEADIPDLARWHSSMAHARLVTEVRTPELWHYELLGRRKRSLQHRYYLIIVNAAGEGVGYLEIAMKEERKRHVYCSAFVVGDQASYVAVFDDVILALRAWVDATIGFVPPLLLFDRGLHPAIYTMIEHKFGGALNSRIYKWYIRVPDPVTFMRVLQPVLERRLEGSGAHRYTGEFKIGFYDLTGIGLKFEHGKLTDVTTIRGKDGYGVVFPWHLFWNVVFGDQSADELRAVLPDVDVEGGVNAVVLDTLFPKKMSWLEGLG